MEQALEVRSFKKNSKPIVKVKSNIGELFGVTIYASGDNTFNMKDKYTMETTIIVDDNGWAEGVIETSNGSVLVCGIYHPGKGISLDVIFNNETPHRYEGIRNEKNYDGWDNYLIRYENEYKKMCLGRTKITTKFSIDKDLIAIAKRISTIKSNLTESQNMLYENTASASKDISNHILSRYEQLRKPWQEEIDKIILTKKKDN